MSLKQRVDKLERKAKPPERPRIFIMLGDGVTVEGQEMSFEEYHERYPDGPGPGDYVLRMTGFKRGWI
jgi:hypothetical protein